jgi:hypothetical protein
MIAWILIPAGIAVIIYADKIVDFVGTVDIAEKIFGAGGTYPFVKVMGLVISILAFMWVTGGLQGVLNATFGRFF